MGFHFKNWLHTYFNEHVHQEQSQEFRALKRPTIYLILRFNNFDYPLYYPKEMNLRSLYVVITESLYANNWHYYQIEQTQVGPEDVVIDCGAAEGLFSLLTAGKCKKVYIIEPLPAFVELLKLTFYKMNNVA